MSEIKNMFSFNDNTLIRVVQQLGYTISDDEHITEKDENQICQICNHEITKKNIGMVIPGSKILLCDNPACFSKYLSQRDEESQRCKADNYHNIF